jgi:hypothetical protein
MAAKRQLLLELLARDSTEQATHSAADNLTTVAEAAEGAAKATDNLGEQAGETKEEVERFGKSNRTAAEHAAELDHEIKNVEHELHQLAVAFAEAETAADRADLTKAIRRTQTELRQLTKSKNLIEDLIPDAKSFEADGAKAGGGFAASFKSALSNAMNAGGEVGPLGPVLIGAGIAAAPIIGATVAAAVVGASGVGGVVGGLLLAKQDARVQAAAKSLSSFIGDELNEAAGPFVPATLAGIGQIRAEFGRMEGDFRSIFASASRYVGPLISGVSGLVENTLHGIRDAVDKAGPVIDVLKQDLPELGHALGDVLSELANDAPTAAAALDQVFKVAEFGIETLGSTLDGLTKVYGFLAGSGLLGEKAQLSWIGYTTASKLAAASSDTLAGSQHDLGIQTKATTDATTAQRKALVDLDKAMRAQVDPLFAFLDGQDKAKKAQDDLTAAIKKYGPRSSEAAAATRNLAEAALDLQDKADAAGITADGKLTPALKRALSAAGLTKGEIAGVRDQLRSAKAALDAYDGTNARATVLLDVRERIDDSGHRIGGYRAEGGPVKKGHVYVVGEKRPELFVPDRDGTIIPSVDQLGAAGSALAGGAGRNQVVEHRLVMDVRGADAELQRLIRKLFRTANLANT